MAHPKLTRALNNLCRITEVPRIRLLLCLDEQVTRIHIRPIARGTPRSVATRIDHAALLNAVVNIRGADFRKSVFLIDLELGVAVDLEASAVLLLDLVGAAAVDHAGSFLAGTWLADLQGCRKRFSPELKIRTATCAASTVVWIVLNVVTNTSASLVALHFANSSLRRSWWGI